MTKLCQKNHELYLQDEEVSNCCNEYIYENTDICSVCHEHCEPITEDES